MLQLALALLVAALLAAGGGAAAAKPADAKFQHEFNVPRENFVASGRNDFFILEPGYKLVLEGEGRHRGDRLIITVLDETREVDGVVTRVVEEREFEDGELAEVSRNFFAIDRTTGDAYYFGEDVDVYEGGKVVGHPGGWLAGQDGARYGMFMPAHPKIGQAFYQEIRPGVAMDRAEIVSLSAKVTVPAGSFDDCLKVEESTPLERGREYKHHARGVGLLTDEGLRLVSHGTAGD